MHLLMYSESYHIVILGTNDLNELKTEFRTNTLTSPRMSRLADP
jgi:hypothetical protein